MERLKELRKARKLTLKKLGCIIGVSESTMSLYENGKHQPDFDTLSKIADYFNVSVDYLLGNDKIVKPRTEIKIPVLGKVQAGYPMEAVENIIDYEEISQEMASKGEYFALQIRGDSMEPKFSEGDVVIVRKQSVVENGDIAIVLVNGDEATVKKFYKKENGVTLMPTNTAKYEPMIFSVEEVNSKPVTVLGKVVELRAKF